MTVWAGPNYDNWTRLTYNINNTCLPTLHTYNDDACFPLYLFDILIIEGR